MKGFVFITLLFLPAMQLAGQSKNVDSLLNILETKNLTTSERLSLYLEISGKYLENDNEKTIKYAGEGLRLAEKENDKAKSSDFCNHLGITYYTISSYDTAYLHLQKAIDFAVEINDKSLEAVAHMSLGNLFRRQANYEEALNSYTMSMRISDSINNKERYATALVNIAGIYRMTKDSEKALEYLEQAELISKEAESTYLQLMVNYQLGTIYQGKKQLDKALEYAHKTNELSRLIGEKKMEITNLYLMAKIYESLSDFDKALSNIQECLLLAEEYGDKRLLMGVIIGAASINLNQQHYEESAALSLKAWNMDTTDLVYARDASFYLTISYIHLGNKEQAVNILSEYNNIIRKIDEKQYQQSLADMEIKYETEKKEILIASLEKERLLYVWLSVSGFLSAVSCCIVLLLMLRNARKKRWLIATESLRKGEISERIRITKDLHDRLGGSLSAVKIGLKNDDNMHKISNKIDICIKELREIMNNIMPASLQRNGLKGALEDFCADFTNLNFHFFGETKRININQEYSLYCCARELVNNALKHADATTINLQLVQSRKYTTLTVQDDGCGFDEKTVLKGYGLDDILDRITACRGKLNIYSEPGKGTETVIELKVESFS